MSFLLMAPGAYKVSSTQSHLPNEREHADRFTIYARASYYVRQPVAFLTSLPIFSSMDGVSLFSAKEVAQKSPSSRFASCWKPKVAYLDLNFAPLWKKQMTLPSF